MGFTVRLATKQDAKLIADISHLTFKETFGSANTERDMEIFLTEQFTKGKLMMEVGGRNNIFMLAYMDDQVAGYLKLRTGFEPPPLRKQKAMEIARLYAMPDMIGKGVGALLMSKAVETAKQKGYKRLWLGVWEKNQRAIDFYTRWGFKKFGETDFLLGTDVQLDWLMQKSIL